MYKINNVSSKYSDKTNLVVGVVTNIVSDNKLTKLTIKAKENMLIYYYSNININLGDKVEVTGKVEKIKDNTNFNLFNYRTYMLSKNTYYKMVCSNIKILQKNKNFLYYIKNKIINRINKISSNNYLNTFILGDNTYLDSNILESYRINGISHLFSISGMHVSIILGIILFILNKIKRNNFNYVVVIIILIIYMFLTSFTPSVVRAIFLFIFIFVNKKFKFGLSTIKILIIIMCLTLLFNPYNIYNTGFKFSYIISIYLIIFKNIINRQKKYILKIFTTSFISFLASIPILINNYFSINFMTIFNNIIFVPIISIFIFPMSLITILIPKLNVIYNFGIRLLEYLSLFFLKYRFELILRKPNNLILILYYFIITIILYKLNKGNKKYIIFLIVLIFLHSNINFFFDETYITFIDVGQGDSSFIHLPHNKGNILIDTGGNINYDISGEIINYLKSEGISKIDYLILTHGDYDHVGATIEFLKKFKIETIIFNIGNYNELETKVIEFLKNKNIIYKNSLNELNIENNKLSFLNTKDYNNENDNSSVIYTEISNIKLLFMGDAGMQKELDILKKYKLKNIDILKVGHHGSNTSSSEKFISNITPKKCLISVGKNNRYGHPNKSVLKILDDCDIYRTDLNGSVKIKFKNKGYEIKKIK